MARNRTSRWSALALALLLGGASGAWAQDAAEEASAAEATGGSSDLAKKLQNPVADLISVPLQFNYDESFGPRDAGRFTLNIQPVIPISLGERWNLISRTILPVIYQESPASGVGSAFGLGDTVQSLFLSPKETVGGWILGAGPVLLLPTGTDSALRSEQLGLGPTFVALQQNHGFTYGALANHIWGVTGPGGERVDATFLQPFLSYTWPTATTLALNTETTYDWNSEDFTVPINLIASQITTISGAPVSFALGGRYYAESPSGGPEWGARFIVTLLFPK